MDLYRGLGVSALIGLIVAASCGGGGGGFNPNDVTVSVSPASITIPAGGQTTLLATVHGLCSSCAPSVLWSIAELQTNGASGAQCNWSGNTQPLGSCPDGTIEGADAVPALTVTYHAPSTSGTFHVTAEWSTLFNPVVAKDRTWVTATQPSARFPRLGGSQISPVRIVLEHLAGGSALGYRGGV